jgi:hypothetical protein
MGGHVLGINVNITGLKELALQLLLYFMRLLILQQIYWQKKKLCGIIK